MRYNKITIQKTRASDAVSELQDDKESNTPKAETVGKEKKSCQNLCFFQVLKEGIKELRYSDWLRPTGGRKRSNLTDCFKHP